MYVSDSKTYGIFAVVILLSSVGVLILQAHKRFDKFWYSARAVAESVKTRTWRFIMRAEPYLDTEHIEVVRKQFCNDLSEVLKQNRNLGDNLLDESINMETISDEMLSIRNLDLNNRLNLYVKDRIDDQRSWYTRKASFNKNQSKKWFLALISFHGIAIVFLLIQIAYTSFSFLPTQLLIVMASSIVTWIQVKKYQDLTTAYTLTAHEIGLIREQSAFVRTESDLSDFVKDAENAFSREHTQWVARKDT